MVPPSRRSRRLHPFVAIAASVAAVAVLASMTRAALHDVSQAWDSGYYHLPFAARLAGILSEGDYVFGRDNTARFAGFPLLGEWLQGMSWRLFGRPEGANLVALASLPLFALSVRGLFDGARVPFGLVVLVLLGIPLVMTHATSTYVDLPASLALSSAFLRAVLLPPSRVSRASNVVTVLLLLCLSTNMRLQHLPPALLVVGILGVRVGHARTRIPTTRRPLLGLVLVLLVFAVPLKNLALHGNPVYPVEISVFGRALPFVETRYSSSPVWLEHAPQPARWLMSILEVGLPPLADPHRYSIDQWTPPSHAGYRMGGSFGVGMVLLFALASVCIFRLPGTFRRRIAVSFAAFTLLTAFLPQSHELRYTLYWPVSLAALALILGIRRFPKTTALLSFALPLAVAMATRGAWLAPGGSTFSELLARKVDHARIDATPEGGVLCISRPPWTWLYAAKFHGRHYTVREDDDSCPASVAVRNASARTASSSRR